jgi:histone H4
VLVLFTHSTSILAMNTPDSGFAVEAAAQIDLGRFQSSVALNTPPTSPVNPRKLENTPETESNTDWGLLVDVPVRLQDSPIAPAAPLRPLARKRLKVLKTGIEGISRNDIRRLARRGGVVRLDDRIYGEVKEVLKDFIGDVLKDATVLTEMGKRKTVTTSDMVYALKRRGINLYGFSA